MTRKLPRLAIRAFAAGIAIAVHAAGSAVAQQPDWISIPLPPEQQAAEQHQIEESLTALKTQRPGVIDAYVIVVALDADPVFNREAREAGRVLASRFDAQGRTLVLAGDEAGSLGPAPGSPERLDLAINRIAGIMDRNEDVLVLYSTSHGSPDAGLVWKDAKRGAGVITPKRLASMLQGAGIKNRLIILQACYSGQFIPALRGPTTVIATAAADDRTSFGCQAGNDWTYFGDALVNHAFRQPLPLDIQFRRAAALISAAEERDGLTPSNPQFSFGSASANWLAALDEREPPTALSPVGQTVLGLGK